MSKPRRTRAEYLHRAELVRRACELAAISRATFDRRPLETRAQLIAAAEARVREESFSRPVEESVAAAGEESPQAAREESASREESPPIPWEVSAHAWSETPTEPADVCLSAVDRNPITAPAQKFPEPFQKMPERSVEEYLEPVQKIKDPVREWWREPLPDWAEGRLEMRNICRDEVTIIHFDEEAVKRRRRRKDEQPVARMWFNED